MDTNDDCDLMEMLGLGDNAKPETPEDEFMTFLTFGKNPRILNLDYWLRSEMDHFHYLKEEGVKITRNVAQRGMVASVDLPEMDYARLMVNYYLCMYFLPRFDKSIGIPGKICDINVTVEKIVALESIQKIILKKYN